MPMALAVFFELSSGGAYTMHADMFSAWEPRAMAGLVNYCLNTSVRDCNPLPLAR